MRIWVNRRGLVGLMMSMKKNYCTRVGLPLFGRLFVSRENRRPEIGHGASKPLSNGRSAWLLGERARQVYVVLFKGSGTEAGHA